MEIFRTDGHLTDGILLILTQHAEPIPEELTRLEAAEHLAFCDECLQRYTDLLETVPLLVPEHSCQRSLQSRLRTRALQSFTSRCATAAAAVALALTMLWGTPRMEFTRPVPEEDRPSVSQQLTGLTGEVNDSLRETVSGLSNFFNGLRPGQFVQGGNHS